MFDAITLNQVIELEKKVSFLKFGFSLASSSADGEIKGFGFDSAAVIHGL